MPFLSSSRRTSIDPEGSALLVTLFFLALIAVVAVGLMTSVRTERSSAHIHFERMRAEHFARRGVDLPVATIRRETAFRYKQKGPDGVERHRYRNFATQPGGLIVPDPPDGTTQDAITQTRLKELVPLSSGSPTVIEHEDPVLDPPNLNVRTFADQDPPSHLLTDRLDATTQRPSEMKVKWIYVRQNRQGNPTEPDDWPEVLDFSEEPDLEDRENPIVGRFAYWVDDESSKVNYNTAWKRDPGPLASTHSNPSRPAHPSRVNMMGLALPTGGFATEKIVDTLFRWRDRSPHRFFNSFADARQVDPELSSLLDFNKFELTHYNHDPDTTFFGESRILLTTRRDLITKKEGRYTRAFLDILRDDLDITQLDPGNINDIAGGQPDWRNDPSGQTLLPNKLDPVIKDLVRYLEENNWPVSSGTFRDKYFPHAPASSRQLAQLAVNILDYVRAKESRQIMVPPLSVSIDGSGKYTLHPASAHSATEVYQGVARAPYITEMGLHVAAEPVTMPIGAAAPPPGWPRDSATGEPKPLYPCYFKAELHLPKNYQTVDSGGMKGINLVPVKTKPFPGNAQRCWFLAFTETNETGRGYYFESPTTSAMLSMEGHPSGAVPILMDDLSSTSSTLQPGKYLTVTKILYREEPQSAATTAMMRCLLYQGTSGADGLLASPMGQWARVNAAPLITPVQYSIGDPTLTSAASLHSIETDDPRCNVSPLDWKPNKDGRNSFGAVNSVSTLGSSPSPSATGKPQQDTDENGMITDFSVYMPQPKGVGSNDINGDDGLVTSIGELGYVATGIDAIGGSTSWRSVRLQPNQFKDSSMPPDWALLDLFGVLHVSNVKVKESSAIFSPHDTGIGGRVNVNSHVEPFPEMERSSALRAVFTGANGLKRKSDAPDIATNIYMRTLASGSNAGKAYGYPWSTAIRTDVHNAFDLPGEICEIKGVADWGEQSEDLIRDVISLLTSRGGVFGIYTVGQSLIQRPDGKLLVTGEQRQHAIMERYVDDQGTLDPADDEVRFRSVYFRNLNP